MNKVYKSVWNESIGAWVAVSENSRAQGKRNGGVATAVIASLVTLGAATSAVAGGTDGGSVETSSDVAVGPSALAQDTGTIAIGMKAYTDGTIGGPAPAGTISGTIAVGYNARALGTGSIALGQDSAVGIVNTPGTEVNDAIAFGHAAVTTGQQAVSLGALASASADSSVALGSGAIADRDNTVSIGNSTTQRQLVQLAAGTQDTDAVNLSQLKAAGLAVDTSGTPTNSFVAYDSTAKDKVTLGGTAGTTITNVKAGALTTTSTDAVNGSQLNATNQNVTNVSNAVTDINNGGGIKYFHVNSTLADSSALGGNSVAVGPTATAIATSDIAIGYNATTGLGANNSTGAIAIGGGATANGAYYNSTGANMAIGAGSVAGQSDASTSQATALGTQAQATTWATTAVGTRSTASGVYASAIGAFSVATGFQANALGTRSTASGISAVALGSYANASADNSVALGTGSVADRTGTVSVGSATTQRQIVNVAAGTQATDAVNVTQLQNVTTLLGGGAKVNADGTIQAPAYAIAGSSFGTVGDALTKVDTELTNKVAYDTTAKSHITLGGVGTTTPVTISNVAAGALSSTSTDAVNGSQLNATNQTVSTLQTFATNVNNGGGIKFFHTNSQLADSSATGAESVAIGGAALSSGKNSVALGSNSVADRDNSVSVGAAGKERQITNVAAGTQSTDAVNVGQLTAVSNNVDTLGSFAVKYDTNTDGTSNYQSVTLGGAGATQPTKITNLQAGDLSATSTDAINGSQLYSSNQRIGSLETFEGNINNGGGIKYFHTNSTLADSSATGADSVAIGGAALSSGKNSVALGSNSVADRDNTVSVGAAGSERQVTNVAAGTASTDAVNVSQLNTVSNNVSTLSAGAMKYDTNADGTPDYANATLGNGNTTGTSLHNVAAGTNDMDAVNLSQVNSLIGQVTNIANNAYNPLFTADGNRDTEIATSSGTHSVASGANAVASGANSIASGATSVASGTNSIAVGSNTSATANNAVAVGANASATANNAVALGAGSVADRANAVSVGTTSAGGQRQITNVAAGTDGTDAVNVNQMQQSVNTGVKSAKGYTDALRSDMDTGLSLANNHINSVGAMSSAMAMMAGSAAAVADKDNRFAAGTGVYRNKAAIAVGFQKRFGTNMVITVGGSTTGEESTGGAGFAFGF